MKRPAFIVAAVAAVLAIGGALLHRAQSEVNQVALDAEPKSVTVVPVKQASYVARRHYVGTLEPWLSASVGPQLASGFVDTVLVRPGAVVKRGQVLATLDCRRASAQNQAIGLQARALEAKQKATANEAARLAGLLAKGFASENEVEQTHAQALASEAQIQALLAQASSQQLEVGDCVLRAPFDGEIAERTADPGAYVRPGQSVLEVLDRSVVRLGGDVPEIDFAAIPPNAPVSIKLLATGAELSGPIARRSPGANSASRTIHFEVDLDNHDRSIPVGTTAEMVVEVGAAVPALELPLLAARIRGKRATVYVVEGATAKRTELEVLGEVGAKLYVKPTLPAGAQVVTQGRATLVNGDRVAARVEEVR